MCDRCLEQPTLSWLENAFEMMNQRRSYIDVSYCARSHAQIFNLYFIFISLFFLCGFTLHHIANKNCVVYFQLYKVYLWSWIETLCQ